MRRFVLRRIGAVILRDGEGRKRSAIADFKLLENVVEVNLDGAIRNVEPAADFLVGQATRDQAHDLPLALGEHRERTFRFGLCSRGAA